MANHRILRRKEVEKKTGLSRSSIYAKMKNGTFPKAIKLGKRSVGWLEESVENWVYSLIIANEA